MILDSLRNAALYSGLGPRFKKAFEYLAETDLLNLPLGKYELDGDRIYVVLQEYNSKLEGQGKWEAHRRYIDIQYIVTGAEKICYAPLPRMQQGDYNETKDFLSLSGAGDFLTLNSGDFAVFHPEDAHMPGMAISDSTPIRKAVVKISII